MNIIQLEDNLKSLPDSNLQNEMINPTGMFPQYLVMSEIQRREEMRNDYQGRMAANEKTPPRPSMREEMMMGITQPQPMMQDSGIAGLLPAQPQGAPIPPTMSASPDVMPMYGGGVVSMNTGSTVYDLTEEELKSVNLYDDPTTEEDETQTELEKAISDYYNTLQTEQPEKIAKERSFNQGINLMKAGLTLGTAGTFKDLSKGLEKTIDSIDASNKAISKKEDDLKKAALDKAKAVASADALKDKKLMDLSKIKTDREYKEKTSKYMKDMYKSTAVKTAEYLNSPEGQSLKTNNPELYNIVMQSLKKGATSGSDWFTRLKANTQFELMQPYISRFGAGYSQVTKILEEQGLKDTPQNRQSIVKDLVRPQLEFQINFLKEEIPELELLEAKAPEEKYSGGVVGKSTKNFNDVIKIING